ncbi:hypothetical protein KSX_57870 [Ktedonospora formicarum]|uniref:Uncharacterized protein n=1 Tax=Ktedonospora formicarum TaxID=2778364 RepID=A0A8J3I1J1_9CHLR|nr:hypothetical protein KSX_57870 [Ktedonospora formicarum]
MYTGKGQSSKENQSAPSDKGAQGRCHRGTRAGKGREMRETHTVLGLIQERGRKWLSVGHATKISLMDAP